MVHVIVDTKKENISLRYDILSTFTSEIVNNPVCVSNGVGLMFDSTKEEECRKAQEHFIGYYTKEKLDNYLKSLEFYKNTKYNPGWIGEQIEEVKKMINDYSSIPPLEMKKYFAYKSVAYIFDETPADELIKQIETNSIEMFGDKYIGVRVVNIEPVKESVIDTLKVKITAYKNRIVIVTVDPDVYDKDFSPNTNGSYACVLSNSKRLGISPEALVLLKQIKRNRDAIGDFMWEDEDSFAWFGSPFAIKDLESEGARTYSVQKNFVTIENKVSESIQQEVDALDNVSDVQIDYNDVKYKPWIDFRLNKETGVYNVSTYNHQKFITNKHITVINAPEGRAYYRDKTLYVKMPEDDAVLLGERISAIIGSNKTFKSLYLSYDDHVNNLGKISKENIIPYVNAFFVNGFDNNIMNPDESYWRLTYEGTVRELLQKLEDVQKSLELELV